MFRIFFQHGSKIYVHLYVARILGSISMTNFDFFYSLFKKIYFLRSNFSYNIFRIMFNAMQKKSKIKNINTKHREVFDVQHSQDVFQ